MKIYGVSSYRDDSHKDEFEVSVAARLEQTYTLNSLKPAMKYNIRVLALNAVGAGNAADFAIETKRDKPQSVSQPVVDKSQITDEYIPVRLQRVTAVNGPIRCVLLLKPLLSALCWVNYLAFVIQVNHLK